MLTDRSVSKYYTRLMALATAGPVILLSVLGFVAAFPVWSADTSLSFEDCVAIAAQNNADLRSARANLSAAEFRERAAHSGFLPQLSGNGGYSDVSGNATAFNNNVGTTYSTGLTATQNLFAGFQDRAKVEQGLAGVDAAGAALDLTKAQLSLDLKNGYAGLLYAQDNVALTESILHRDEENLRLVQLRFESGRENKGSYLVTSAGVSQARLDNLQARQALSSVRTQLAGVLGQSLVNSKAVGTVLVSAPPISPPDFLALTHGTPDFRNAVAKARSAQADIDLSRSGFYPSVNLNGSTTRETERGYATGDRSVNAVSATISIPLYSGGKDYYGTRAASAALDAAKANQESTEQQLLVKLEENYAAYVESIERLKVNKEFLDAAETRATISRARYQNGLMTFEDWDRVESDLVQRQKNYLASQRDRITAEAAWEFAQGKGVIP